MSKKKSNWLKNFIKGLKPMKDKENKTNDMNMKILNKIYDRKPGESRSKMMNQVRMNTGERPLSKEEQAITDKAVKRRQEADKKKRIAKNKKKTTENKQLLANDKKLCTLSNVSCPSESKMKDNILNRGKKGAPWYSSENKY